MFKLGLKAILNYLEPSSVIVHGYMPSSVFDDYTYSTSFYRFPSEFESAHLKQGD